MVHDLYRIKRSPPDPRDHYYRSHRTSGKTAPEAFDLRRMCTVPVNQRDYSSCTGNEIASIWEFEEFKHHGSSPRFSRMFPWYLERQHEHTVNQDTGAFIRDGIKLAAKFGIPEEHFWPYNKEHWNKKPSKEAYTAALNHRAAIYKRVPQTVEAMTHVLGVDKHPIILGIDIYDFFESDEVAKSGIVRMPKKGDKCLGGHCVLVVGYDKKRKVFIVRNSWGKTWGMKGYFEIPFAYLLSKKLCSDLWYVARIRT